METEHNLQQHHLFIESFLLWKKFMDFISPDVTHTVKASILKVHADKIEWKLLVWIKTKENKLSIHTRKKHNNLNLITPWRIL